jgi:hypothetical protein
MKMNRFICSFFSEKSGSFTDTFCEIFCSEKSRNFILDTIGNYSNLIKNPRVIGNSRVEPKKLAFFYTLVYNFKWHLKKINLIQKGASSLSVFLGHFILIFESPLLTPKN